MLRHSIETCPDDHEALRVRLDELSAEGARILAVLWQPRRPDPADQAAAFNSLGSFVIVSEGTGADGRVEWSVGATAEELRA
ncbi:MAG: hypothetical protein QM699_15855 [Amaricoccus sp.]|uniref:hypothetical protein n=1 Tax=Amaricoccus sp. TaxID=1872485 RepID=UPI0039E4DB05